MNDPIVSINEDLLLDIETYSFFRYKNLATLNCAANYFNRESGIQSSSVDEEEIFYYPCIDDGISVVHVISQYDDFKWLSDFLDYVKSKSSTEREKFISFNPGDIARHKTNKHTMLGIYEVNKELRYAKCEWFGTNNDLHSNEINFDLLIPFVRSEEMSVRRLLWSRPDIAQKLIDKHINTVADLSISNKEVYSSLNVNGILEMNLAILNMHSQR